MLTFHWSAKPVALLVQSHRESNTVMHLLRNNKDKTDGKIKSCFKEIPWKFSARSHWDNSKVIWKRRHPSIPKFIQDAVPCDLANASLHSDEVSFHEGQQQWTLNSVGILALGRTGIMAHCWRGREDWNVKENIQTNKQSWRLLSTHTHIHIQSVGC